jgi:hypothetical protein
VTGAIAYTGNATNGIKLTSSTGGGIVAPQQGDTVEQRAQWTHFAASSPNGAICPLILDAGNWIGISTKTASLITVRYGLANNGGTTLATFTAPGSASGDTIVCQIKNISGVYTVEVSLNGTKLALASGSADVTAIVTGGGPLAAARKSGIICRTGSSSAYIRAWTNQVASAPL